MHRTVTARTVAPSDGPSPSSPTVMAYPAEAVQRACARIAPTWPLDRFIAVNPLWGFIDAPLPEVSARLGGLSGVRLAMPRAWYRERWRSGELGVEHLREAIQESGADRSVAQLLAVLEAEEPAPPRRAQVVDVVDAQRDLVHQVAWRDFITNSLSQVCAAYFDRGQASLPAPPPTVPEHAPSEVSVEVPRPQLYASFLQRARDDLSPALLMGLPRATKLARALPSDARVLIAQALVALDVPAAEHERYLTALLLDINGWAAWCAYARWTARLEGRDDGHLVDLLAARLAWEWMLLRAGGPPLAARWQRAMAAWPSIDSAARAAQEDDWILQRAVELVYQRDLCRDLARGLAPAAAPAPAAGRRAVQAVFCIDIRSEVYRRALEAQSPEVQTLGFAGFFGLPIEYVPPGAPSATPRLPGLLAPRLRVTACASPSLGASRRERLSLKQTWTDFKAGALSSFSFVESVGLLYAAKLVGDSLGTTRPAPGPERAGLSAAERATLRPRLQETTVGARLGHQERLELAAGVLRSMSLTSGFARLVVLIGHGSSTVNNPHSAGLDCGACCGQTGEVNARALAALLNDPAVRAGLAGRGVHIPAETRFVGGLHVTTTDDVELFEVEELPQTHAPDVTQLTAWLSAASERARAERAPRLGLGHLAGAKLTRAVRARARDWAQVRPEWGLVDNAAFIVAPRERVKQLNLGGRSFLHDYRWEQDEGFAVLELIMTAPMVVTHWINFQYYASTVDNVRYGSGNKVLHNVVGGGVGVFEGNGGDLRIGLPLQSLHDGARWVHTPLRLSVFIEAPRRAMEAVLAKHAQVRDLVQNAWLYLFQLDAERGEVHAYRGGPEAAWARVP